LYWDRTGFCVWAKRLNEGRLISDWDAVTTLEMDWTGLKLLLEVIVARRERKRYIYLRDRAEMSRSAGCCAV
jgi:transposase